LTISPLRKVLGRTSSATTATALSPTVGRYGDDGRATFGDRASAIAPRPGRARPATTIATRITRNGRPWGMAYFGNQDHGAWNFVISDWVMPSAMPAAAVIANERNRPTRATASAGTMSSE